MSDEIRDSAEYASFRDIVDGIVREPLHIVRDDIDKGCKSVDDRLEELADEVASNQQSLATKISDQGRSLEQHMTQQASTAVQACAEEIARASELAGQAQNEASKELTELGDALHKQIDDSTLNARNKLLELQSAIVEGIATAAELAGKAQNEASKELTELGDALHKQIGNSTLNTSNKLLELESAIVDLRTILTEESEHADSRKTELAAEIEKYRTEHVQMKRELDAQQSRLTWLLIGIITLVLVIGGLTGFQTFGT